MSRDATVQLVGNVGGEISLFTSNSGMAIANFSVALRESRKNSDGEYEEADASWVSVTAFGDLAENVAVSITKGTRVVVLGHLTEDRWQAEDGSNRSKIKVIANEVTPSLRWATADVTKIGRD